MNKVIVKYKNEDIDNDECFNDNQNECLICIDNDKLMIQIV